jgi:hypothetical protein
VIETAKQCQRADRDNHDDEDSHLTRKRMESAENGAAGMRATWMGKPERVRLSG